MINKDFFEGPVGDYCIARNTIKCLFLLVKRCYANQSSFFNYVNNDVIFARQRRASHAK